MTDMEAYQLGLKEKEETWWWEKIQDLAADVRSGEFGEVVEETKKYSGWFDGIKLPHFVLRHPERGLIDVKVNESGVWYSTGAGWGRLDL